MGTSIKSQETFISVVHNTLSTEKKKICPFPVTHKAGKYLRSKLLLTTFKATVTKEKPYHFAALVYLAAAVELIHESSLIVDDIFDKAQLRRGEEPLYKQIGHNQALLTAHLFLLHAGKLILHNTPPTNNLHLIDEFFNDMTDLVQGEMDQQRNTNPQHIDHTNAISNYLKRATGKTASLFVMSAILGATTAQASPDIIEYLRKVVILLGRTFQIKDDINDLYRKKDASEKDYQNDLKIGTISFPIAVALAQEKPATSLTSFVETFTFETIKEKVDHLFQKECRQIYIVIEKAPYGIDKEPIKEIVEQILSIRYRQ